MQFKFKNSKPKYVITHAIHAHYVATLTGPLSIFHGGLSPAWPQSTTILLVEIFSLDNLILLDRISATPPVHFNISKARTNLGNSRNSGGNGASRPVVVATPPVGSVSEVIKYRFVLHKSQNCYRPLLTSSACFKHDATRRDAYTSRWLLLCCPLDSLFSYISFIKTVFVFFCATKMWGVGSPSVAEASTLKTCLFLYRTVIMPNFVVLG